MAVGTLNVQVLQANVDLGDESHFRILVGGKFTKYITVDTGLYNLDDMCFAPSLIPLCHLSHLATGMWDTSPRIRRMVARTLRQPRRFHSQRSRTSGIPLK